MATDLPHEPSLDDQPPKGAAVPEPARLRLRFPLSTIAAFMTLAIVDINGGWLIGLLVETLPFDRRLPDEWLLLSIHTSRLFCWRIAGCPGLLAKPLVATLTMPLALTVLPCSH